MRATEMGSASSLAKNPHAFEGSSLGPSEGERGPLRVLSVLIVALRWRDSRENLCLQLNFIEGLEERRKRRGVRKRDHVVEGKLDAEGEEGLAHEIEIYQAFKWNSGVNLKDQQCKSARLQMKWMGTEERRRRTVKDGELEVKRRVWSEVEKQRRPIPSVRF